MAEESVGAAAALRIVMEDMERSLAENANNLVARLALEKLQRKWKKLQALAEKGQFEKMLADK